MENEYVLLRNHSGARKGTIFSFDTDLKLYVEKDRKSLPQGAFFSFTEAYVLQNNCLFRKYNGVHWEITQIKYPGNDRVVDKTEVNEAHFIGNESNIHKLLAQGDFIITKVILSVANMQRREFTVNQSYLKFDSGGICKIGRFGFFKDDNHIYAFSKNDDEEYLGDTDWWQPRVVFISDDNVMIREGDLYCSVFKTPPYSIYEFQAHLGGHFAENTARFSTREAAYEFIQKQKKPIITTHDGVDLYDLNSKVYIVDIKKNKLLNFNGIKLLYWVAGFCAFDILLSSQKYKGITSSESYLAFSTYYAANEYLNNQNDQHKDDYAVKPPIGLLPEEIYQNNCDVNRLNDIYKAMERYISVNKPIPQQWSSEMVKLEKKLKISV